MASSVSSSSGSTTTYSSFFNQPDVSKLGTNHVEVIKYPSGDIYMKVDNQKVFIPDYLFERFEKDWKKSKKPIEDLTIKDLQAFVDKESIILAYKIEKLLEQMKKKPQKPHANRLFRSEIKDNGKVTFAKFNDPLTEVMGQKTFDIDTMFCFKGYFSSLLSTMLSCLDLVSKIVGKQKTTLPLAQYQYNHLLFKYYVLKHPEVMYKFLLELFHKSQNIVNNIVFKIEDYPDCLPKGKKNHDILEIVLTSKDPVIKEAIKKLFVILSDTTTADNISALSLFMYFYKVFSDLDDSVDSFIEKQDFGFLHDILLKFNASLTQSDRHFVNFLKDNWPIVVLSFLNCLGEKNLDRFKSRIGLVPACMTDMFKKYSIKQKAIKK